MSCKAPEVDEGPGLGVGICGGDGPGQRHGIRSAAEAARGGRIRRKAAADESESGGDDGVWRREGQVTSTAALTGGEMQRDTGESTRRSGAAVLLQWQPNSSGVHAQIRGSGTKCMYLRVGGGLFLAEASSPAARCRRMQCNWWIRFDTEESTGSSRKRCGLFHRGWVGA